MKSNLVLLTAYCFVICAILPLAARGASDQPNHFSPEVQKALESAVARDLSAYGGQERVPGAVVGIWASGKGPFVKGIGLSDLSTQKPMDTRDKFRVGSNTKTFVVTVLLQLVDEKKLSLDDKLSQFDVGVSVPNAENITVRQLCNMTSGLFEVYHAPQWDHMEITPRTKFDPRELVALAVKNPPDFPPGKGWHYSNTGFCSWA